MASAVCPAPLARLCVRVGPGALLGRVGAEPALGSASGVGGGAWGGGLGTEGGFGDAWGKKGPRFWLFGVFRCRCLQVLSL